ncbi:hypothetical protein HZU77_003110 [Neisseriaceae bacterium TC5R-5]|nr:hypothetical protein [Neisseriaceae bacterium TC5R-5]
MTKQIKKGPSKAELDWQRWLQVKQGIITAAQKAGVDPATLARIAYFESTGFKVNARPIAGKKNAHLNNTKQFDGVMAMSSAYGLGQFTDDTWLGMLKKYGDKYGIANAKNLTKVQANQYRKNTTLQAAMLAEFSRENVEIGKRYGGQDDSANVYALHNLGQGGGKKFLKALKENPNIKISEILSRNIISRNRGLYKDGSISVKEAYLNMSKMMDLGERFAQDTASPSFGILSDQRANSKQVENKTAESVTKPAVQSAENLNTNIKKANDILNQRKNFKGYKYKLGGKGEKNSKGVNLIDCSNLVNQAVKGAGYDIPYENTKSLKGSKYYDAVDPKDVKPGDIALWSGHTGIVEQFDTKTSKGTFFGSQTSTGPASAKFGKDNGYWGEPLKYIRPKSEYLKDGSSTQAKQQQAQEQIQARKIAAANAAKQKADEQAKARKVSEANALKKKADEQPKADKIAGNNASKQTSKPTGQDSAATITTPAPAGQASSPGELQTIVAQLQITVAQLQAMLAQPINISVDVQDGNIVAFVQQQISQDGRRG